MSISFIMSVRLSLHLSISSLVVLPTRQSLIFLKFYTRLQGVTSQMTVVRTVTERKPETPHTCIGSAHSNSCYNAATITNSLHEHTTHVSELMSNVTRLILTGRKHVCIHLNGYGNFPYTFLLSR
jgi:hypothetical protein